MGKRAANTPGRVLIVDDDPALREMLAMGLEAAGYAVAQAQSREAALQALDGFHPHVVVLDLGMPPHEHGLEEGLAVLRWLQAHPRALKVIVLTGQDPERSAFEAVKLGAFDYLTKPVELPALVRAFERSLLFLQQERQLREQEQHQRVVLSLPLGAGVKPARNVAEEQLLRQVLEETGFNIHETARRLRMTRENVYYLLKKYAIKRPE